MRSAEISRLYLQVPPDEPLDARPDDRIWAELNARLALDTGFALNEGPAPGTPRRRRVRRLAGRLPDRLEVDPERMRANIGAELEKLLDPPDYLAATAELITAAVSRHTDRRTA